MFADPQGGPLQIWVWASKKCCALGGLPHFVHYLEWAATWLAFIRALAGFYKALESLCLLQCRQNLLLSPNRAGNSARKVPHISNVLAERYLGNMKGWIGYYFGLYSVSSKRLPGPPKHLPRDIPKSSRPTYSPPGRLKWEQERKNQRVHRHMHFTSKMEQVK